MGEKDLHAAYRHEKRRQKLPSDHCLNCGTTDIRVLQSVTLCAECRLEVQGKSTLEKHHVVGRENDPFTVNIPANDHAVLSDMENDWKDVMVSNRFLIWLYAYRDILKHTSELTENEIKYQEGEND